MSSLDAAGAWCWGFIVGSLAACDMVMMVMMLLSLFLCLRGVVIVVVDANVVEAGGIET